MLNKTESKTFLVRSSRTKYLQYRSHTLFQRDEKETNGFCIPEFIRMCPWETETFFELFTAHAKIGAIEVGRFNGGSTLAMAMGSQTTPIVSIDIAPQNDQALVQIMQKMNVGFNVKLAVGDSKAFTPKRPDGSDHEFDFLLIDGDHSRQACLADITTWWPRLMPGGLMVLHDCYASLDKESCENTQGVLEATLEFLRNNSCTILSHPTFSDRPWESVNGSLFIASKN
jgi:predicted O-methyltransferase YrrM